MPLPLIKDLLKSLPKREAKLPDDYYDTRVTIARDLAFTVSGVAQLEAIQRVLDSLDRNIQTGGSFASWKKEAVANEAFADLPKYRKELVFRNHAGTAFMAGKCRNIKEIKTSRPYLMYSAVGDSRTRPAHKRWDGTVLPVDHSWWRTHMPSNGHNCILPDNEIQGDVQLGIRSHYAGEAIKIITASGNNISLTPNHRVLTGRGWIAAKEVTNTDNLFRYLHGGKGSGVSWMVNNDNPPTKAQKLFDALSLHGFGSIKPSSLNLDDDAGLRKGDINVAGFDCELMHGFQSISSNRFKYWGFNRANAGKVIIRLHNSIGSARHSIGLIVNTILFKDADNVGRGTASSSTNSNLSAIGGVFVKAKNSLFKLSIFKVSSGPSSSTLALNSSFGGFDFLPFKNFRLRLSSYFYPLFDKDASNCASTDAIGLRKGVFTLARKIPLADLLARGKRLSSYWLAFPGLPCSGLEFFRVGDSIYNSAKDSDRDSMLLSDISASLSRDIVTDDVVGVDVFNFSGHVYDFQTNNSLIIANNLLIHNCRCSTVSLTARQANKLGITEESDIDWSEPDEGWEYSPCENRTQGEVRALENKIESGYYHESFKPVAESLIESYAVISQLIQDAAES